MKFCCRPRTWPGALRPSLLSSLALMSLTLPVTSRAFEFGVETLAVDSFAAQSLPEDFALPIDAGGAFDTRAEAWQVAEDEGRFPSAMQRGGLELFERNEAFVHDHWNPRRGGMGGGYGGYGYGIPFGDDQDDGDCHRYCRDWPLAVPEPGTAELLLAGVAAGLVLSLRRNRKSRSR